MTNRDLVQCEKTLPLDTKAANESIVNDTVITEGQEIELAEPSLLVDFYPLSHFSAKHAIVENLQRRVHGEYSAASNTKRLIHNPVPEIIPRPHAIFSGLVFPDDDPLERYCDWWREYSSWLNVSA
jgi:hypothetical protein